MELLQELVNLVKNAKISELTVRVGDWRVTVRKNPQSITTSTAVTFARCEEQEAAAEEQKAATAEQKQETSQYVPVTSNWVGIVRRLKGGKPLVQVGDSVKRGQTLCWVDSLGVQNEVRSPVAGCIVDIFAGDGQPVEFGQQLMLVEVAGGE